MHKDDAKEKTEARGIRLPVSVWRLLGAVQSKRGDQTLNDTIACGLTEWSREKIMDEAA